MDESERSPREVMSRLFSDEARFREQFVPETRLGWRTGDLLESASDVDFI